MEYVWGQDSSLIHFWSQHLEQLRTHGRSSRNTCGMNETSHKHAFSLALAVSVLCRLIPGLKPHWGQLETLGPSLAQSQAAETPQDSSNCLIHPPTPHLPGGWHIEWDCLRLIDRKSTLSFPPGSFLWFLLPREACLSLECYNLSHMLSTLALPVGGDHKADSAGRQEGGPQDSVSRRCATAQGKLDICGLWPPQNCVSIVSPFCKKGNRGADVRPLTQGYTASKRWTQNPKPDLSDTQVHGLSTTERGWHPMKTK